MIKLLFVEDDPNFSYIMKCELEDIIGGYKVIIATNGKEGLEAWKEQQPNIIISDIEMPKMTGYEMVEHIRETDGSIPILFASAHTSSTDVTRGYKFGVNNYIKKPFTPEELDAHVKALLKIKNDIRFKSESKNKKLGNYTLDAEHGLLKHKSGTIITLTAREAQILQMLCENKGEIIKREVILEKFWDTNADISFASRSLDVFITKLRKKTVADGSVEIKTIKGVGIKLIENNI